jgi:hypothetical protein
VTPRAGTNSTHLAAADHRRFKHDRDFPLSLVFSRSEYRYAEPWYVGVSRGMAFVQIFRAMDQVRFSQAPWGGGKGNPAWDFQSFIPDYKVGQRYQMVMRAMYVPFTYLERLARATRRHRKALSSR